MQLIYRGIHYKLNPSTHTEVSAETAVGKYRGTALRIEQFVLRSPFEAITILRYRGNDYVKQRTVC
jgi:hypothetical protein